MEEGSLRCDANVSVRPASATTLGTKVEVKNLNSFRFLQKALDYEIERQVDVIGDGGRIVQETRLWDSTAGRTVGMRSKEEAHDYRYFPEPDLPPLIVDTARVRAIRERMPELPDARRQRFVTEYALPRYDAVLLTQNRALADYFEAVIQAGAQPKHASNWIMGELGRKLKELAIDISAIPLPAERLASLLVLVERGRISGSMAKDVLEKMFTSGRTAEDIIKAEGLAQIDDESAIVALIEGVLTANADAALQYRAGKTATFGFLVGQVMKAAAGKANPKRVNELLKRALEVG
jgi:aspartyl-tRNA(Asn)/glutamyl-tRNA(Gln) amidotransferase subunit B